MIFFGWAGRSPGKSFKLPSSSPLLVIIGVAAAVIGIVIATRQGRRFAARKLLPSLRSSLASLRRVARSPARLTMLFGGSALITLAYVGGLVASVAAFGGGASSARIGAAYMASAAIAAASASGLPPGHRAELAVLLCLSRRSQSRAEAEELLLHEVIEIMTIVIVAINVYGRPPHADDRCVRRDRDVR